MAPSAQEHLPESESRSRYVVGIDLGTTNSAVCFVDTQRPGWRVETFPVPQLVAPNQVESRETLPSFHYQPAQGEFLQGSLRLPWEEREKGAVVGVFAREQGKLVPGRVVESAKSWLCHPGVDRTAPLLPWHGSEDALRFSPVDVTAAFLAHVREAWNHARPDQRLEHQEVVVTLPASFDEVARELTVEAARKGGIPRVLLIEEPQAAFYAWINAHPDNWNRSVAPGQNILVCDIGGGTSDFTLIRVRAHPREEVQFHRVAVGDHLILGGDNLDLALAHHLERKLSAQRSRSTLGTRGSASPGLDEAATSASAEGNELEPRQWGTLVRLCRHAKEVLLDEQAPETYAITLPGKGAKLIGGGMQLDLSREEARQLLLEGFFPRVPLDEKPQQKRSGFQEFGLPYAPDPAVTRYLAAFLSEHCLPSGSQVPLAGRPVPAATSTDAEPVRESHKPDVVLFNGGVFVSPVIRERVSASLRDWFSGDNPHWEPLVLENDRHDLAVARGAAYYGMVRRGEGVRIAAGLPRTYYIGVSTAAEGSSPRLQALSLMPAGAEPGEEVVLEQYTFHLTVAAPVQFPLFYSSTRLTDPAGTLVPVEPEQLSALPPIRTVLRSRKHKESVSIPVHLHARLTEIGTLQVWCSEVAGGRTWQLQFDVRSATQTDVSAHLGTGEAAGVVDQETIGACARVLENSFGPRALEKPAGLPKRLAREMGMSRDEWPPSLLRQMWEMLMEFEPARARSAEHEARWLNLLGFSLRPGFGVALDDWRVSETWKSLRGRLHHPGPTCISEWWILWRRIAGGLPAGQQQAVALPLLTGLRDEHRKASRSGNPRRPKRGAGMQVQSESWRMLGALERLSVRSKIELGSFAAGFLDDPAREPVWPALLWSLGRIGAREPFYGPLNGVISPETVSEWIERLIGPRQSTAERQLAVMQLARRTGDRYRDIPPPLRERVVHWLTATAAPEHFVALVESGGELGDREEALVFGESLPIGLQLHV